LATLEVGDDHGKRGTFYGKVDHGKEAHFMVR
jgi:hypothetical protein